ncbi:hypothetical protein Bca52824_079601 [Brassica carinata]|uniref:OVATE domain-containing protein n=1 Tax=Brassica carinata TaxID=52824 RepID=A0A8X7Q0J4_BRACI|nr:hypothetical protein Bca52824_079601 [Brassica carinata]
MWKRFHHCFPSNLNNPSSSPSDAAASDDDPNRPSILLINNVNLLYNDSSPLTDPYPSTSSTPNLPPPRHSLPRPPPRSMQEMLDAVTDAGDVRRYEFLHELLLSYLSLNAADTHKFIIRAFADILVSLLSDGHRTS